MRLTPCTRRWRKRSSWSRELQPRRAWFTHIAHDLPHQETNERLVREGFPHVQLAYDGLSFEVARERLRRAAFHGGVGGALRPFGAGAPCFRSAISMACTSAIRKFFAQVIERAQSARAIAGVITFDPHPLKVLRPAQAPPMVETLSQRLERVRRHRTRRRAGPAL